MKPKKLLAALLAAACFLGTTGCASQSIAATDLTKNVKKAEQTVCLDEDTQDKTIEEVTGFGVKLLQSEMENENPLLSPLSILAALSMTANGAAGETKTQMEAALGANAETIQATADYLFWTVLLGSAPSILNVVLAYLVRAEGSSLHASIGTMCGCLLNIVLDPIFILPWGLNLGAAGAGCATCLSNTVACLYFFVLLFVKRGKTYVCIKPSMFRPSKQIVKGVCGVGIPASIQNLLNVTGMTILNNFTSAYGSDPVAAMGIAQRVNIVPFQIAMGFSQGIMPLISYNYASGNIKRMKKTFTFTAKISLGFILAVMLTFVVAAEPIISMFMKNESIVAYGAAFQRGFCFALPFLCIDFLALGVFQSCGMGMKSFIFAVVRKIVLEIPALFVLNWLFPLYGLAYAQFVAELILGTIAVVVLVRMFRRLEREHAAPYVSDSESVK